MLVEDAIKALKNGAKILTDTYMAEAAISPMAKRTLHSDIKCILGMAPASIDSNLTTRSAIGMKNMWLDFEEKDHVKKSSISCNWEFTNSFDFFIRSC